MKTLFTTLLGSLIAFSLFSQTEKGLTPASKKNTTATGVTYAVVIGISDYQDEGIPDLSFADKDAEAFAEWLRSPAGGSLDGDHLRLFTNEQATTAQFDAALGWLIDESKEGDQAIIYFSGHGDVETKTRSQQGFLLCWDSPPQAYVSGAYPIFFLKEVVSTLSMENKSRVLVITDACRSGKLAGSSIGGSQLTSLNLAQQFSNEVKILSCQPNEYSVEGKQWGGGRGAFSFHLLDGLYGMADNNNDASVNLLEIGRYLEDNVTSEVAPHSQVPMTVGNRTERLAQVVPDILVQVRQGKMGQLPSFSQMEPKGIEEEVLATVDTTVRQLYRLFKKAVKEKLFFEPTEACADAYYKRLIAEPKLERLHNSMRRNYAAALQDDAQQAVNGLMKIEPTETRLYRLERLKKYAPYPQLLSRAAELLGEGHYMYPTLQARKCYFEGHVLQMESPINKDTVLGQRMLSKYRESLRWEPDAALTYLGMAEVFTSVIPSIDSFNFYCQHAIAIAPNWLEAYFRLDRALTVNRRYDSAKMILDQEISIDSNNARVWSHYGYWYYFQGYPDAAEPYIRRAIALDSSWQTPWAHLGYIYFQKGKMAESRHYFMKAAELERPDPYIFMLLGSIAYNAGQWEEAEKWQKRGLEIEPNDAGCMVFLAGTYLKMQRKAEAEELIAQAMAYDSSTVTLQGIAEQYTDNGLYDKANALLLRCVGIDSLDYSPWMFLGYNWLKAGRYAAAVSPLSKAYALAPNEVVAVSLLGQVYTKMNRYEDARKVFDKMLEIDPEHPDVFVNFATLAAAEGKPREALDFAEKAFQKGMTYSQIYEYPYFDFSPVRALPGFKDLEKKYFPDQAKD